MAGGSSSSHVFPSETNGITSYAAFVSPGNTRLELDPPIPSAVAEQGSPAAEAGGRRGVVVVCGGGWSSSSRVFPSETNAG